MRERPRDKARLGHILTACDVIADALVRFGYEPMLADPILYHGLIKHIEIIGEAVYMLSKEFKSLHPEAEWQAIEDLRHVLVHGYDQINPALLRPIVEKEIPALRPVIQRLYDAEE